MNSLFILQADTWNALLAGGSCYRAAVCHDLCLLEHRHMRYFTRFLVGSNDDIDISVHCDMTIFDWLIRCVRARAPSLAAFARCLSWHS